MCRPGRILQGGNLFLHIFLTSYPQQVLMDPDQTNINMSFNHSLLDVRLANLNAKMNPWMIMQHVVQYVRIRKQKIIQKNMKSMKTRRLGEPGEAQVVLKFMKKQLTSIVHRSLYPIFWMNLFLFLQTYMNSCFHPFLILSKGANGSCYTGKFP